MSEPFEEITRGSEVIPVCRENLFLYRHLGSNAIFDHCYINIADNKDGIYVWSYYSNFEKFALLAVKHKAMIILNKIEPSPSDVEYYVQHSMGLDINATGTLPLEWLPQE